MTDFTLTIAAGFADGVGNLMTPSHWTTPLGQIETLLQGRVGRDGVGIDNWNGDNALRALNFREGGLAEVHRRTLIGEDWGVGRATAAGATTAGGIAAAPGGTMRFFMRTAGTAWVNFAARVIHSALAAAPPPVATFDLRAYLDGVAGPGVGYVSQYTPQTAASDAHDAVMLATWSAALAAGWHVIEHRMELGQPDSHIVFGRTDLAVVAVYR